MGNSKEFFAVRQFCEHHAWATEGGIRHLIFHAQENGFHRCIKRLGRRILLDEAAVFEWLSDGKEGSTHATT